MTHTINRRVSALWGASSLALAAMFGAPAAFAQDAPTAGEGEDETIVVIGQRLANRDAIETKREAVVVSDVLSADDLNQLPDQNLAEALSRVSGLTAFQDEGAGLYVGIRGLNQEFVNLTLDGVEVSSSARTFDTNLRGANLEAVPSTFVSRVEVIKSVTPDLDADAIAGTVNLVPRSALDADESWLSLGLALGRYDEDVPADDNDISSRGNLSFGRAFANNTIGIVFDANFRSIDRDNLKPDAWFGARGGGALLPEEVGGFFYQREEDSWGATWRLEFRPNSSFQGFLSATYFDSDIEIDKNKHALYGAASNATTGTFSNGVGTSRNDHVEYGVDGSLTLSVGGEWFIDARNTLSFRGQTSESTSYQDDPRVDWYYGGPLAGTYAFDGQAYTYEFNTASAANWANPANYAFNGYRRFQEELERNVDVIRIDWSHADPDGLGLGYEAGVKWRETSVDYTSSNFRWDRPIGSPNFAQFLYVADYQFPGTNNPSVLMGDIEDLSAFAEGLGASGFGRIRSVVNNGLDYNVTETVGAAYGLIDYGAERFRVVAGVRYEHTETEAFNRFNQAENAPFVETAGSYGNWLPSVAFTYFMSDNLLLRLGASRTLGRPDIRDLARGETPPNDNGIYSRGNPDLEPRLSTNLDASLEYYFDDGASLVSVAVFSKQIEDEIFNLQTPYIFTNDLGDDVESYYTQPDNGGDASITGVELSLVVDSIRFLPGPLENIGVAANVTFNSGELDLLAADRSVVRTVNPEGLSERLANLTIYYEGERFSARAAWRYASEQTQALSIDGSSDLQLDDYQQTDLQFGYRLSETVELFGEVWNVFEDEQTFTNQNFVAGPPNWFEEVRYGRAVWFGVNLRR